MKTNSRLCNEVLSALNLEEDTQAREYIERALAAARREGRVEGLRTAKAAMERLGYLESAAVIWDLATALPAPPAASESRSVQRRVAAQRGEPAPTFPPAAPVFECATCGGNAFRNGKCAMCKPAAPAEQHHNCPKCGGGKPGISHDKGALCEGCWQREYESLDDDDKLSALVERHPIPSTRYGTAAPAERCATCGCMEGHPIHGPCPHLSHRVEPCTRHPWQPAPKGTL